jgi:hypothetical protein
MHKGTEISSSVESRQTRLDRWALKSVEAGDSENMRPRVWFFQKG